MSAVYTIHGAQDLHFSTGNDETAMVIQTFHRGGKAKLVEVMDRNGDFYSVAAGHGRKVEIKVNGYKRNASVNTAIGATVTLNNQTAIGGITPTDIVLTEANEDEDVENFVKLDNAYTGYPFSQ